MVCAAETGCCIYEACARWTNSTAAAYAKHCNSRWIKLKMMRIYGDDVDDVMRNYHIPASCAGTWSHQAVLDETSGIGLKPSQQS